MTIWSTSTRSRKQAGPIHPRQRVVTPSTMNTGRGPARASTSHPPQPSSACLSCARHSRAFQLAESPSRLIQKPRPQVKEFPFLRVTSLYFFTHYREAAPLTSLQLSNKSLLLDGTNTKTYHTPRIRNTPSTTPPTWHASVNVCSSTRCAFFKKLSVHTHLLTLFLCYA